MHELIPIAPERINGLPCGRSEFEGGLGHVSQDLIFFGWIPCHLYSLYSIAKFPTPNLSGSEHLDGKGRPQSFRARIEGPLPCHPLQIFRICGTRTAPLTNDHFVRTGELSSPKVLFWSLASIGGLDSCRSRLKAVLHRRPPGSASIHDVFAVPGGLALQRRRKRLERRAKRLPQKLPREWASFAEPSIQGFRTPL